jgi:hypothetical protein
MTADGNKAFYDGLADKNLGQATAAQDALRKIKESTAGHTRADVDREERQAKDAIGRAADAVRTLVEVGD